MIGHYLGGSYSIDAGTITAQCIWLNYLEMVTGTKLHSNEKL